MLAVNVSELSGVGGVPGGGGAGGLQAMLAGWAGAGAVELGERDMRPDAPRKVQCLPLPGDSHTHT